MHREDVLRRLDRAWAELQGAYAGLNAADMVEPGVTEEWSVKDILGHVTTWEEEALEALPIILAGRRPPRYADRYGGINAFNALRSAEKRDLDLATVLAQLQATHGRLMEAVRAAPDEQLAGDTPFRRRLRADTYSHYSVHARTIREWRERRGI